MDWIQCLRLILQKKHDRMSAHARSLSDILDTRFTLTYLKPKLHSIVAQRLRGDTIVR